MQDILKQATGLKSNASGEQLLKAINKNAYEIEQSIRDLISGLDQSLRAKNGAITYPRLNTKKVTDFHELKFPDI